VGGYYPKGRWVMIFSRASVGGNPYPRDPPVQLIGPVRQDIRWNLGNQKLAPE